MYIESVPNRNSPPAILLRESYRDGGKIKKRTIANLSHWPTEIVEGLRTLLKGGRVAAADQETIVVRRALPHGHVAAVLGTLRDIGLDRLLGPSGNRCRDLVIAMIVARLIAPASKLATARMLDPLTAAFSLGETLGLGSVDEDELYVALDWLGERQETVERALDLYGAPVYVRKQIVHNLHVVRDLEARGAVFVDDENDVPEGETVVFSAHGIAPSVFTNAAARGLETIDATCPLVTKVHREAEIHHRRGREIVLIGHAGHPEVVGTMGQLPPGSITLVEDEDDVDQFVPRDEEKLAYVTQTTLSVQDTQHLVERLKARFPHVVGPHKEDICYATTNRQEAVRRVAPLVDAMVVVGSRNSSNSQRLKEVAEKSGCAFAVLIDRAANIDWSRFAHVERLGVTAGASAPEVLVEEVLDAFAERFALSVETVSAAEEDMFFPLPRVLREQAAE